jgi:hypothetical protein
MQQRERSEQRRLQERRHESRTDDAATQSWLARRTRA